MQRRIIVEVNKRGRHCDMCDGVQEVVAEISDEAFSDDGFLDNKPWIANIVYVCKACLTRAIKAIDAAILEDDK